MTEPLNQTISELINIALEFYEIIYIVDMIDILNAMVIHYVCIINANTNMFNIKTNPM